METYAFGLGNIYFAQIFPTDLIGRGVPLLRCSSMPKPVKIAPTVVKSKFIFLLFGVENRSESKLK